MQDQQFLEQIINKLDFLIKKEKNNEERERPNYRYILIKMTKGIAIECKINSIIDTDNDKDASIYLSIKNFVSAWHFFFFENHYKE